MQNKLQNHIRHKQINRSNNQIIKKRHSKVKIYSAKQELKLAKQVCSARDAI